MEKTFLCKDTSGGGRTSQELDEQHIRKYWELEDTDEDGEQTLDEYLEDCEIGDEWKGMDRLELTRIK